MGAQRAVLGGGGGFLVKIRQKNLVAPYLRPPAYNARCDMAMRQLSSA